MWSFSVIDIIQVMTVQLDYQKARKYRNKLSERLRKERSESVSNCHRLKLKAADRNKYLTEPILFNKTGIEIDSNKEKLGVSYTK